MFIGAKDEAEKQLICCAVTISIGTTSPIINIESNAKSKSEQNEH
jgi:hypothetical protein